MKLQNLVAVIFCGLTLVLPYDCSPVIPSNSQHEQDIYPEEGGANFQAHLPEQEEAPVARPNNIPEVLGTNNLTNTVNVSSGSHGRLEELSLQDLTSMEESRNSPIGNIDKRKDNDRGSLENQGFEESDDEEMDPGQSSELTQMEVSYNETSQNTEINEEMIGADVISESENLANQSKTNVNETLTGNFIQQEQVDVSKSGETGESDLLQHIGNEQITGQNETDVASNSISQNPAPLTGDEIDNEVNDIPFNRSISQVTRPSLANEETDVLPEKPEQSNEHEEEVAKTTEYLPMIRSTQNEADRYNEEVTNNEPGNQAETGNEEYIKGFGTESLAGESINNPIQSFTREPQGLSVTEHLTGNSDNGEPQHGTNTEPGVPLPNINPGEGTYVEPGENEPGSGEKDKLYPDTESGNETYSYEHETLQNQTREEENIPQAHSQTELLPTTSKQDDNTTEQQENNQEEINSVTETIKIPTESDKESGTTPRGNSDHESEFETTTKHLGEHDHNTEEVIVGSVTEETIPKLPGETGSDQVILPDSTVEPIVIHGKNPEENYPVTDKVITSSYFYSHLETSYISSESEYLQTFSPSLLYSHQDFRNVLSTSNPSTSNTNIIITQQPVSSLFSLATQVSTPLTETVIKTSSDSVSLFPTQSSISNADQSPKFDADQSSKFNAAQSSLFNSFQSSKDMWQESSSFTFSRIETSRPLAGEDSSHSVCCSTWSSGEYTSTEKISSASSITMTTRQSVIVTLPRFSLSTKPLPKTSILSSTVSASIPQTSELTDSLYIPDSSYIPNAQSMTVTQVSENQFSRLPSDSAHRATQSVTHSEASHVTTRNILPSPSVAYLPSVSHHLVLNDSGINPQIPTTNRYRTTHVVTSTPHNLPHGTTTKQATNDVNFNITTRWRSSPLTSQSTLTSSPRTTKKESDNIPSTKKPAKYPKDPEKVSFSTGPWSSTEKGIVTVKPEYSKPQVFIEIRLEMTWLEFCPIRMQFVFELQQIVQDQFTIKVRGDQIILQTVDCQKLRDDESKREVIEELYMRDKNGNIDEELTTSFFEYIVPGFHSLKNSHFETKIKNVTLINKKSFGIKNPEVLKPNVKKSELGSGITVAIIIASVGGFCCICLIILQLIIHKRQGGKRMQAFVPGSCRQSFRSMDSIALGAVAYSRPHSGFWNPGLEQDENHSTAPSHLLGYTSLANFTMDIDGVHDEFEKLPNHMPSLICVPIGAEDKNRFANVIPFPATRVKLKKIPEEENSDYINANYVTGYKNDSKAYIATQAPLSNTVKDFWRMVWEQQSRVILMLSVMDEHGQPKGTHYVPDEEGINGRVQHGDYMILLKKKEVHQEYIVSTLQLKDIENNLLREIKHFWYTCWSKDSLPEPISLVKFILDTRPHYEDSGAPVIVHCSPGTGRTGTVIATDICMRSYENRRMVDILNCLHHMRQERAGSVQTKEQYALIYKAVFEYAVVMSSPTISNTSSTVTFHNML